MNVTTPARQRLHVRGVVQGVGFRPFVYALALQYGLGGYVGNDSSGVFIEVEGETASLAAFREALQTRPPPLVHISTIQVTEVSPTGQAGFAIVESHEVSAAHTLVSPDICICDDCLREMMDPHDRRYRYPFINCTHCGPRYTVIRDLPYDRPLTSMAEFPLCPTCQAEYDDPLNRRFHAQPTACPVCGPQVWLSRAEARYDGDEAVRAAVELLSAGSIVAIKGIGGFHLACNALNDAALLRLRERKGRVEKPFAVMVHDLDMARRYALVDEAEAALLTSRARPIVLLRKRADSGLSNSVAPGNPLVGLMLPYAPLHTLLLQDEPLVMTSGNLSGEPICIDNTDAGTRLTGLADALLYHDRDIVAACDDSVMRVTASGALPIRRSRGYAPFPVLLPWPIPTVLAAGAELKNTCCLAHESHGFMSQHIGDMENIETVETLAQVSAHLERLFRAQAEVIAADRHPRYLSSRWAAVEAERRGLPLVLVQHHHAHIAAVMAENGLPGDERVIGVCFDGTGYGDDGAIWGGEVFVADYGSYERAAHLRYMPLVGGDHAVKHPGRLALAYLQAAGIEWDDRLPPVQSTSPGERRIIARQIERQLQVVPTSSMGRLFDVTAALLGVRQTITYEAQAAIELEALADDHVEDEDAYPFPVHEGERSDAAWQLDGHVLIEAVVHDVLSGVAGGIIAARFHHAVANGVLATAIRLRRRSGLNTVALSGGVFQNVRLLGGVTQRLIAQQFRVLTHRLIPPNDGGLALGQAVVAAWRCKQQG